MPELNELINQFEAEDETLAKAEESYKEHLADLKARGFEKEIREEIKQTRLEKTALLDSNISSQRAYYEAQLPGMLEDLNQVTKAPSNKIYIR